MYDNPVRTKYVRNLWAGRTCVTFGDEGLA